MKIFSENRRVISPLRQRPATLSRSIATAALLAFSMTPGTACAAESAVPVSPGSLLVASASLQDPNFRRSVVLVVKHGEAGTVGLVLTRPLDISPSDLFPNLEALATYAGLVYSGGPVMPFNMLTLFRADARPDHTEPVTNGMWLGSMRALELALGSRSSDATRVRLFAGHAGWHPGQLAQEILSGAWHVTNADTDRIFLNEPESLWQQLLPARQYRASLDR